jgi:nucleotide-binding universal stress UspA family protein
MPRTILFPVQDSEISRNSIRWSLSRIVAPEDKIILVIFNEKPSSNSASKLVSHYQTSFFSKFESVECEVLVGDDSKACLRDFINAKTPDLCIIGSRGNQGVKKIAAGGSFSEYLLKNINVPILISKNDLNELTLSPTTANRKICFPVDKSEKSAYALTWYQKTLSGENDEIILVTVVKSDDLRKEGEELIKTLGQQYLAGKNLKTVILTGTVNETLVKYLNESKPDFCAIATRGLRGVQKFLAGSVTEYVLNKSEDVPILVIQ